MVPIIGYSCRKIQPVRPLPTFVEDLAQRIINFVVQSFYLLFLHRYRTFSALPVLREKPRR